MAVNVRCLPVIGHAHAYILCLHLNKNVIFALRTVKKRKFMERCIILLRNLAMMATWLDLRMKQLLSLIRKNNKFVFVRSFIDYIIHRPFTCWWFDWLVYWLIGFPIISLVDYFYCLVCRSHCFFDLLIAQLDLVAPLNQGWHAWTLLLFWKLLDWLIDWSIDQMNQWLFHDYPTLQLKSRWLRFWSLCWLCWWISFH